MGIWTAVGCILALAGLVLSFIFSRAWFKSLVFILLCQTVLEVADFVLVPSGYIRFILNQLGAEDGYEAMVFGASHGRSAINPYELEKKLGKHSINVSIPGETMADSYYLLKEACRKQIPEVVVLDLDYQYWCNFTEREFGDTFIYSQMKWSAVKLQYVVDNLLTKDFRAFFMKRWAWVSSWKEMMKNIRTKMSADYWNYDIDAVEVRDAGGPYVGKGYFRRKKDTADKGVYKAFTWDESLIYTTAQEYFDKIADYCEQQDITLICVTSPLPPKTAKKGPSKKACAYFRKITGKRDIPYFDCNLLKAVASRKNEDYVDWDGHMTGELADWYSAALGGVLADYLDGKSVKEYFYPDYESLSLEAEP